MFPNICFMLTVPLQVNKEIIILHLSKKLRTVFPSRSVGSLVTPSTSAMVLYRSSMYWGGCLCPRTRAEGVSSIPNTSKSLLMASERTSSDSFSRWFTDGLQTASPIMEIQITAGNMLTDPQEMFFGSWSWTEWSTARLAGIYMMLVKSSVNSRKELLFRFKCKSTISECKANLMAVLTRCELYWWSCGEILRGN